MGAGEGLLYSDPLNGGVFCVDRKGNVTPVFAYRKGIGEMSVHENGGMIVSGRNISWKLLSEGDTVTVLDQNKAAGLIGFNDITTDEVGRIYAESLGSEPVLKTTGNPGPGTCI